MATPFLTEAKLPLRRWLIAFALIVCAAAVASYTVRAVEARSMAISVARREAENLAQSLSDQASDTCEAVNEILLTFSQRVKTLGTGTAARLQLRDELAELVATMPRIHRLDVIDEHGRFVVSNISATPDWLPSLADRAYFRYHRAHTDPSVRISGPALSRTEKMWVIFATRRIDKADGTFGGVLIAPIPFEYFEQTYRHVDVGHSGSITLIADNGTVMMREPRSHIGQSFATRPLFAGGYAYEQAGSYIDAGQPDEAKTLVAFRRLGRYPLVVAVALAESEYLSDWRSDVSRNGFTVGVFLILIGVLTVWLDAQIRRSNRAEAELARLALVDGLTGLANRRQFDSILAREWRQAARDSVPLALLMIDIDNFKAYNDTYGHQAGDVVLSTIARVMAASIHRPSDLAARYGGEEFAVILPATDGVAVLTVAERLRSAVAALALPHSGSAASIATVSIGTASTVPSRLADADAGRLIKAADDALYVAKHAGRNRVASAPVEPPSVTPACVAVAKTSRS